MVIIIEKQATHVTTLYLSMMVCSKTSAMHHAYYEVEKKKVLQKGKKTRGLGCRHRLFSIYHNAVTELAIITLLEQEEEPVQEANRSEA